MYVWREIEIELVEREREIEIELVERERDRNRVGRERERNRVGRERERNRVGPRNFYYSIRIYPRLVNILNLFIILGAIIQLPWELIYNPSCPVLPALPFFHLWFLPYPSCPILPVLFLVSLSFMSFPSCLIFPVQSLLSNPSSCPILHAPILPVQSFLFNPSFPIFPVLCHSSLIQSKLYIYWHWRRHNCSSYFKINPAQKLSNLSTFLFRKTKHNFAWIPYLPPNFL